MAQNANNTAGCGCNDYSQLAANTGIATISSANTKLDGTGSVSVLTAKASNPGTIIKSIIIKAAMPVTQGMVRLFIKNTNNQYSLYKEIPIPTTPVLANTPTPAPIMKTFEITLEGGLKLNESYELYASTQNSETFNVIAEGLDWSYQGNLPPGCCSFKQETAVTGLDTVDTANLNLDGTGTIVPILTAAASPSLGTLIKAITIKAMQSTNEGMVRLFISPSGGSPAWSLMKEICIPQTTQSGFDPSFKAVLEENLSIAPGYQIGASTQIGQGFAITIEGISWVYPTY